jgi:hypothetical protein
MWRSQRQTRIVVSVWAVDFPIQSTVSSFRNIRRNLGYPPLNARFCHLRYRLAHPAQSGFCSIGMITEKEIRRFYAEDEMRNRLLIFWT